MMTQDRRSEFVVIAVMVVSRRAGFGFLLPLPTGSSDNTDDVAIGLLCTAGTADRYGVRE
jgi:hypothetical protein